MSGTSSSFGQQLSPTELQDWDYCQNRLSSLVVVVVACRGRGLVVKCEGGVNQPIGTEVLTVLLLVSSPQSPHKLLKAVFSMQRHITTADFDCAVAANLFWSEGLPQ